MFSKKIHFFNKIGFILIAILLCTTNVFAQGGAVVNDPAVTSLTALQKIEDTTKTKLEFEKKYKETANSITRKIMSRLLAKVKKSAIKWALTGFKGGDPFFIKNPEQFNQNIAFKEGAIALSYLEKSPFKDQVTNFAGKSLFQNVTGLETNLPAGVTVDEWKARLSGESDQLSLTDYGSLAFSGDNLTPLDTAFNFAAKVYSNTEKETEKISDQLAQGDGFLSDTKCKDGSKVKIRGKDVCLQEVIKKPSGLVSEKIVSELINAPAIKKALDASSGESKDAIDEVIKSINEFLPEGQDVDSLFQGFSDQAVNGAAGLIGMVIDEIKTDEQELFEALTGTGTDNPNPEGGNGGTSPGFNTPGDAFDINNIMNTAPLDDLLYGSRVPLLDANGEYVLDEKGGTVFATVPGQTVPLRDGHGIITYIETYKQALEEEQLLLVGFPIALRDLDRCIPGPDYGYESRLTDAYSRRVGTLSSGTSDAKQDKLERFNTMQAYMISWPKTQLQNDALLMNMAQNVGIGARYSTERKREIVDQIQDIATVRAEIVSIEDALQDGLDTGEEATLRAKIIRLVNNGRIPNDLVVDLQRDNVKTTTLRLGLITKAKEKCEDYMIKPENSLKRLGAFIDIWQCPTAGVNVSGKSIGNGDLTEKFMEDLAAQSGIGPWPHANYTIADSGSVYLLGIPAFDADRIDFNKANKVGVTDASYELELFDKGGEPGSQMPLGQVKYRLSDSSGQQFYIVPNRNNTFSIGAKTTLEVQRVKNYVKGGDPESFDWPVLKIDCSDYMEGRTTDYDPSGVYGF